MAYILRKINASEAKEISTWRYPEPYSFYNPDDEAMEMYAAYLLEPRFNYHTIYEGEALVGFCCYGEDAQVPGGDYSLADALDIGVGMKPELIGQGRGRGFLEAILGYAQDHYEMNYFRSTIADFNRRSQRLFTNAGFQPVQRFLTDFGGIMEFIVLLKKL